MLSSSLLLLALIALASARASPSHHSRISRQRRGNGYALANDLSGQPLLDFFRFETQQDGSAQYVDEQTAKSRGLVTINSDNSVRLAVSTAVNESPRASIRLSTNSVFNSGLFVLDAASVPVGCGTWGAFWTVGHDQCTWPNCGELDIFETVNEQTANTYSCHTKDGATMQSGSGSLFTAEFMLDSDLKTDCSVSATSDQGCGLRDTVQTTAGRPLNQAGGAVMAMEYTASGVSMFLFNRSSVPADLTSGSPDPSTWGTPKALFNGFDVMSFVNNQILVLNTALCGTWPSGIWSDSAAYAGQTQSCAALTGVATCEDYIANHGDQLGDAFWQINSLKIYQQS